MVSNSRTRVCSYFAMAHQQLVKPRLRYLRVLLAFVRLIAEASPGVAYLCPIRRDVKLAIPTRFQPLLSALETYYYSNFPGDACWPTLIKRIFGDTEGDWNRLKLVSIRYSCRWMNGKEVNRKDFHDFAIDVDDDRSRRTRCLPPLRVFYFKDRWTMRRGLIANNTEGFALRTKRKSRLIGMHDEIIGVSVTLALIVAFRIITILRI